MRSFLLRSLLLLTTTILPQAGCSGCGGPPVQEGKPGQDIVAGLDVASDTGSEMDAQAMTSYVWARPSGTLLFCIMAPCPNREVYGVDGSESRLVHHFDLRALGLSKEDEEALRGRLGQLLTRGRFVSWRFMGQSIVVFQITRFVESAAAGTAEHPDADQYYQLRFSDACQGDGCPQWRGTPLNRKLETPPAWGELDLSPMGLTPPQQQVLLLKLRNKGGYVSVQQTPTAIPLVTQAFVKP